MCAAVSTVECEPLEERDTREGMRAAYRAANAACQAVHIPRDPAGSSRIYASKAEHWAPIQTHNIADRSANCTDPSL